MILLGSVIKSVPTRGSADPGSNPSPDANFSLKLTNKIIYEIEINIIFIEEMLLLVNMFPIVGL